jgi:hypothetical protein
VLYESVWVNFLPHSQIKKIEEVPLRINAGFLFARCAFVLIFLPPWYIKKMEGVSLKINAG